MDASASVAARSIPARTGSGLHEDPGDVVRDEVCRSAAMATRSARRVSLTATVRR
jgi:hypothetical protein